MTDKQIKEEIDVSQCECYSVEDNSCNKTLSGSCIKEKCQTFRLLQTIKVKEQECENWQKELDKTHLLMLEKQDKLIKEFFNNEQLKLENTKYKQTLAEIKEIAEECYYECNSMNNCNISCKYYNDCNGEFSYLLAYLNKQISEVENDNK